jgi:hypothetical protein
LNVYGNQTTSLDAIKILVDRAKNVGFNGIVLDMQAPINAKTGLISYTDSGPSSIKKTIPKDTWRVVDYIKSQGLYVWIKIEIADSITDCRPDFTINNVSASVVFNSYSEFSTTIATTAQQHNVDGIFLQGVPLDTVEYKNYWANVVSKIRSVFAGKLGLSAYYETSVISLFDYFNYGASAPLSTTPIYDLAKIVSLYSNNVFGLNEVQMLKNVYSKYSKKIILTSNYSAADNGVNYDPPGFWTAMLTGNFVAPTTAFSPTNTQMKLLKIQALLELIGTQLSDVTDGVTFIGFSPWLELTDFSNPNSALYKYYASAGNLTEDLDAQKVLNTYFSKPWGYHTIQ